MTTNNLDLLITAKNVRCDATGLNGSADIGVRDGKIASVGERGIRQTESSAEILKFDDGIVLPGLVDLHAHPARSGSKFGIDPDVCLLPRGSTTVLSQGDAGARNLDEYVEETILGYRTRVKLAINFCADGESNPDGRFFSMAEASVDECVAAIERGGDHVWGISLNIALIRGENIDPLEVMRRGMEAAERTGKPVIFGATKNFEVPLSEQLELLRPGDLMTYCFHHGPGSIVEDGRVQDCVWEARERGVLFDVGDGAAAFGFDTAEVAISEGFLPDTISTDYYNNHFNNGMEHDLPLVISKMVASGMSIDDCWSRATSVPASVMGLGDTIGRIEVGAEADFCVMRKSHTQETLHDGHGQTRDGYRWRPVTTIKGGEVV